MAATAILDEVAGLPFWRVLGESPAVGEGNLYRYTVYVEDGIRIHKVRFAKEVDAVLADSRSWARGGDVAFQRVSKWAGTSVCLATPDTVDKLCAPLETNGYVSCQMGFRVVLNIDRWFNGVPHWTGSIKNYRRMVVNHEWGHRIGQSHRYCPGAGKKAPVMQQQTYGLQGCRENSWPLDSELHGGGR